MSYVTSAEIQEGCVFCSRGAADPAENRAHGVLVRAPRNFVILNAYPYNSGHLMVVPYLHLSDFTQLPPEVLAEMAALAQLSLSALQQVYGAEGANIGLNIGKVAGAGIRDHLHLHVVPRWGGDTNFMAALAETRVVPQSLADTHDQLAPVLQALVEARLAGSLPDFGAHPA